MHVKSIVRLYLDLCITIEHTYTYQWYSWSVLEYRHKRQETQRKSVPSDQGPLDIRGMLFLKANSFLISTDN